MGFPMTIKFLNQELLLITWGSPHKIWIQADEYGMWRAYWLDPRKNQMTEAMAIDKDQFRSDLLERIKEFIKRSGDDLVYPEEFKRMLYPDHLST